MFRNSIRLFFLLKGVAVDFSQTGKNTGCWFENWVIRKISGPKKDEIMEAGRNYFLRRFMIGIPHEMKSV